METPVTILHDAFSRLAAVSDAEHKLEAIRFLIFVCGSCPISKFLKLGLDALVGLSKTETFGTQIVEQGAVLKLVQLLGKSDDTEVLGKASEALCNLATHKNGRSTMIQEGAVRFLVHTCATLKNSVALGHSALALSHMAMDPSSPKIFIQEGAVTALVALIGRLVLYPPTHSKLTLLFCHK